MRGWLAATIAMLPALAAAQSVSMSGSLGDKALLLIDGAPRTVAVGATVGGVKVIRVSGSETVVEVGGKRQTLALGGAQVNLGGVASAGGGTQIVLAAGPGGHFVTGGSINGRAVRFVVDTGATFVAMGEAEARRIGLDYARGQRGLINTANGQVISHRDLARRGARGRRDGLQRRRRGGAGGHGDDPAGQQLPDALPDEARFGRPGARQEALMAGFTPEWARHAVWYQILPERFANGSRGDDPTPASVDGSQHAGALPAGWRPHPWTSDWYALQPWEAASGKPLMANLADRRYGGDLAGILQRLPYLQDLGVNAIYLNPVFDAPSHHKYDASTLHHVDVHLGPDPEGDRALMAREVGDDPSTWVWTAADRQLLELIAAVHARGMRHHPRRRVQPRRPAALGVPRSAREAARLALRRLVQGQVVRRRARRLPVRDAGAATPRCPSSARRATTSPRARAPTSRRSRGAGWRPTAMSSRGIDGWRLDVAPWLPHGFWKHWRRTVKAINPDAYLVAENIRDVAFNVPFLEGDEFDAVMNYNFAFACDEFFFRDTTRITASRFDALLTRTARGLPGLRGAGDAEPVRQPRHGAAGLARHEPRPARLPRLRRDLPSARLACAGARHAAAR